MEWRTPSIYKEEWMRNFVTVMTLVGSALALFTVIAAVVSETANTLIKVLIVIWVIFPPTWYWCEYIYLFDKSKKEDGLFPNRFERLKYRQVLGRNIWAAIIALLFFRFFKG